MFRRDSEHDIDSEQVRKTKAFSLPLSRNRHGNYKHLPGTLFFTAFTTDFFLEEIDQWRDEAWEIMRTRSDCHFYMVTKRPQRITQCLPPDWGDGWENVTIACTMESQQQMELRMPFYRKATIAHKEIICEPMLGPINFGDLIKGNWLDHTIVGGESGPNARTLKHDWVLSVRSQCIFHRVPFHFKQTGAHYLKDGRVYHIDRRFQLSQARQANLDIEI